MRRALSFMAVVLAVAGVGCGPDPVGPEPEECPTNRVNLTVGTGVQPQFTWTPRCHLGWLTVQDSSTSSIVWDVTGRGNHLPSGLRYDGTLPTEAVVMQRAQDLQRGRVYTVLVYRLVCEDPERQLLCSLLPASSASFTP